MLRSVLTSASFVTSRVCADSLEMKGEAPLMTDRGDKSGRGAECVARTCHLVNGL